MRRFWGVTVALVAVTGFMTACAAPERISRSGVEAVRLGETTVEEIKAKYGPQDLMYAETTPETGVTKLSYAHMDPNATPCNPGVYPIQQIEFFFKTGTLQGVQYMSSLATDCTKFDDSKVADIQVGKTTREDIQNWLGSPHGKFLTNGKLAWRYVYVQKIRHSREYDHQVLDILFDEKNVVQDFKRESLMGVM